MKTILLRWLSLSLLLPAAAVAEPLHEPPPGVLGILALPALLESTGCGSRPSVPVYAAPNAQAPVGTLHARIEAPQDDGACYARAAYVQRGNAQLALPLMEYGYDTPGAVVVAVQDGWVALPLPGQRVWLRTGEGAIFHSLPALLQEGLLYFTDPPPQLCAAPAATPRCTMAVPAESGIELLGLRKHGGRSWLQLRLVSAPCGSAGEPKTYGEGWLPLVREDGRPAVWFHARGC